MSSAQCIIFKNPRQIGAPMSTVFIGLDLPSLSFSWTSWFIDAFGLLSFFFLLCFFFLLPQFSKDSDVSGLAPTLSINRFKSNKCGIFSRTCVHSPCFDCKAVCFHHVCHLFHFFFVFLKPAGYARARLIIEPFSKSTRPLLLSRVLMHHFIPASLTSPFLSPPCPPRPNFPLLIHQYITIIRSASTVFRMLLNQSQGPLSKLLAFICGIIKMLHKLVSGFLSLLVSFPFCHMGGLLFPLVSQQVEAMFAYSELVEIFYFFGKHNHMEPFILFWCIAFIMRYLILPFFSNLWNHILLLYCIPTRNSFPIRHFLFSAVRLHRLPRPAEGDTLQVIAVEFLCCAGDRLSSWGPTTVP